MVEEIRKSMQPEVDQNVNSEFYRMISEKLQRIFIEVVKNQVELIRSQQSTQLQVSNSEQWTQLTQQLLQQKIEDLDIKVKKIKSMMYNFGKGDKNNSFSIQEAIIKKLEIDNEIQCILRDVREQQTTTGKKQMIEKVLNDSNWNQNVTR